MSNTSAVRTLLIDDLERAWSWLEHWGHEPFRVSLDDMELFDLMDRKAEVQLRVRVLAENWSTWY